MYGNNQLVGQGLAAAAITPFSFVKQAGVNDQIQLAAAATDVILGVGPDYAVAINVMTKYTMSGVAQLKLGTGGCTAGNELVSDASGFGVAAATTGTVNQGVGAIALRTGSAGDIIPVRVVMFPNRAALT